MTSNNKKQSLCLPFLCTTTSRSSQEQRSKKQKRNIVFHQHVTVLEIPARSTLTQAQRQSMWYSRRELQDQKEAVQLMKCQMADGSVVYPDEFGLETPGQRDQRRQVHDEVMRAVMIEQLIQWEEGEDDPELIADVCLEKTHHMQRKAQIRGEQHARVVQEYYAHPTITRKSKLSFEEECPLSLKKNLANPVTLHTSLFELEDGALKKALWMDFKVVDLEI